MSLLDKKELEEKIMKNPELLLSIIKEKPKLLDYVFSDSQIARKYVRIPSNSEKKLKEVSNTSGVAEGILIGLGIVLLLKFLFDDKKG